MPWGGTAAGAGKLRLPLQQEIASCRLIPSRPRPPPSARLVRVDGFKEVLTILTQQQDLCGEVAMLTGMTEGDWAAVVKLFRACRSRRGDKGRNDRKFLEALHYFTVHNITWRALPAEFGNWNSIWKRFWRLSQAGVFEALFEALAANSQTAHLVQMFDSTTVRAHVSAAGARRDGEKGGPRARPSAARAGASRPRSTSRSISTACRSPST